MGCSPSGLGPLAGWRLDLARMGRRGWAEVGGPLGSPAQLAVAVGRLPRPDPEGSRDGSGWLAGRRGAAPGGGGGGGEASGGGAPDPGGGEGARRRGAPGAAR